MSTIKNNKENIANNSNTITILLGMYFWTCQTFKSFLDFWNFLTKKLLVEDWDLEMWFYHKWNLKGTRKDTIFKHFNKYLVLFQSSPILYSKEYFSLYLNTCNLSRFLWFNLDKNCFFRGLSKKETCLRGGLAEWPYFE